jgi:hypothetical protein
LQEVEPWVVIDIDVQLELPRWIVLLEKLWENEALTFLDQASSKGTPEKYAVCHRSLFSFIRRHEWKAPLSVERGGIRCV